jgi:MscS family membrane protein
MDLTLIITISSILLACFILSIASLYIYKRNIKRFEISPRVWDDALFRALHKPIIYIIWLWGFALIAQLLIPTLIKPEYGKWIILFREAGTLLLLTWFLYRLVYRLDINYYKSLDRYSEYIDQATASAVSKAAKICVFIFGILIFIKYFFNVPLTGLWAIGGAGSIIIGFAAKDMLANFFGGFMFFFDRPFAIGDLIRLTLVQNSSNEKLEGWVERIGWRLTQIRTREMMPLYVPNSIFATSGIENLTNRSLRLINETFGFQYKDIDKVQIITDEITQMLHEHEHIDNSVHCYASIVKLENSWIDMNIYCYSKETKRVPYFKVKQDILIKVVKICYKHDVENANPTSTLEIPKGLTVYSKKEEIDKTLNEQDKED